MSRTKLIAVIAGLAFLPAQLLAADLARGQRLYNMHCASCHGVNGMPVVPNAPNFAMRERLAVPDVELSQTLMNGMNMRTGRSHMPPYIGLLKEQEMMDVLQYIRLIR